MINSAIIIAIVTGLATAIPSVIATYTMNNAREAIQTERMNNMSAKLDLLDKKVDRLSDFDKRISLLEQEVEMLVSKLEG